MEFEFRSDSCSAWEPVDKEEALSDMLQYVEDLEYLMCGFNNGHIFKTHKGIYRRARTG